MVSLHISIVAHVERPLKINIMDQILQSSLLTKWFIVTTCVFFSEIELIHAALNGVFGSQEEPPSPSVTSLSSTFVLLSSDTFSTILSSTEGMNGEEVGSKTLPQLWIDHEQMSQSPDWSQTVSNLSSPLTSVTSSPQTYISTKSDTSGHIMTPPRDTREGDGVDSSDFKVRCRIPPCPTHGQWNISHSSRTDGNCPSDKMVDSGFYLTYKCNTGYFKCQQRKLVCNDGIWEPSAQNLCLPDGCRNLTLLDPLLSARYTHNGETKCFNASHQQNGTVIQYSCKSGYKIQDMDPRQATCSGNSWTPKQIPSCVKVACQDIRLQNGFVEYKKRNQNSSLPHRGHNLTGMFTCMDGYRLEGQKIISCYNGVWEKTLPECIEEPCSVTELGHYGFTIHYEIPFGSENLTAVQKPAGTIAYLSCRSHAFANLTRKCERGKWEGEELDCLKIYGSASSQPSSSSASVMPSSYTSRRSTSSTESITGEEMVTDLVNVTVWLLAAAVVVNTTLAVSILIIKRKRTARCEQTAEHGSTNEPRAENNSSLFQMETNLCALSNRTTDGEKNDIMVDNIVYESAVDTPTPSEENGGKNSSTTRNELAPIYECIV